MKVKNVSQGTEALVQSTKSEAEKPKVIDDDELVKFQEASGALKLIGNGRYYQVGKVDGDHTDYSDRTILILVILTMMSTLISKWTKHVNYPFSLRPLERTTN